MPRLAVEKTFKLYINGQLPRSESGRSLPVRDADWNVVCRVAHASRKDLRNAVVAARGAFPGWSGRDAYNRGQIIYRMAEMLEGKADEFAAALRATGSYTPAETRREVAASVDRLLAFAGWADKYHQVLGGQNPVSGPFWNVTLAEPTGVVVCVCPDHAPLLALVSLLAPALAAGDAAVVVASPANPLPAAVLGEVCATSDLPPGVVNILTGDRAELIDWIARHRDVDAVHALGLPSDQTAALRAGAAENLKRVAHHDLDEDDLHDRERCESPLWIEPLIEYKTVWHPAAT